MFRMPIRLSLALVLAAVLSAGPGAAQIPIDQDDLLEDVSQYSPPWFAELQDVEIDGDLAYVFGVGGLAIFDISNPAVPIELGRYEPQGHPYNRYYRGAVNGGLACGGAREDLLAIIDVSNPSFPQVLALHGIPGQSFEGAAMQGDYIYACRHDQGLEVVDITNPLAPVTAAELAGLTNSWDVELSGQYAFVADGAGGLAVVNIANPVVPVLVTSVATSGSAVDVEVSGSTAVVCTGSAVSRIILPLARRATPAGARVAYRGSLAGGSGRVRAAAWAPRRPARGGGRCAPMIRPLRRARGPERPPRRPRRSPSRRRFAAAG